MRVTARINQVQSGCLMARVVETGLKARIAARATSLLPDDTPSGGERGQG